MKRVLLFLLLCLFVVGIKAQTQNYDFTADYNGVTIYLKITDAAKHYVEFEAKEPGYETPGYKHLTTIPTKVTNAATGIEYEVKSIGDRALLSNDAKISMFQKVLSIWVMFFISVSPFFSLLIKDYICPQL